jgi:hypothetical protein
MHGLKKSERAGRYLRDTGWKSRTYKLLSASALAALLLIASTGCRHPQAVVVERAADPCLAKSPPQFPTVHSANRKRGCPEPWDTCMNEPDADALAEWSRTARLWMDLAWDNCGPAPRNLLQ